MSILTRLIDAIAPLGFEDSTGFHFGQPVDPEQGPRRLRHDSGHQRLERGRFSKGANQSNHGSASK